MMDLCKSIDVDFFARNFSHYSEQLAIEFVDKQSKNGDFPIFQGYVSLPEGTIKEMADV